MHQLAYSNEERLQREYIAAQGENGAETVVNTWLDIAALPPGARAHLRVDLIGVLKRDLSDLELAELAAAAVGNQSFEDWLQNQEG